MRRRELRLRECPTDMENIIKHLVWSFASKFWQNEISMTGYGQNLVRVVTG